jgi:hypothetical protein
MDNPFGAKNAALFKGIEKMAKKKCVVVFFCHDTQRIDLLMQKDSVEIANKEGKVYFSAKKQYKELKADGNKMLINDAEQYLLQEHYLGDKMRENNFYKLEYGNFVEFDNWNVLKYKEYEGYKSFNRVLMEKFKSQCRYVDTPE